MSRIGKKPIPLPKGVTVTQATGQLEVKGPKGTLKVPIPEGVAVRQSDGKLELTREADR